MKKLFSSLAWALVIVVLLFWLDHQWLPFLGKLVPDNMQPGVHDGMAFGLSVVDRPLTFIVSMTMVFLALYLYRASEGASLARRPLALTTVHLAAVIGAIFAVFPTLLFGWYAGLLVFVCCVVIIVVATSLLAGSIALLAYSFDRMER